MEAPTTNRFNRHYLPPISGAGPRGPATSGRTSPPFPRRPSERDMQRSTQAPTRQETVRPARLRPPSQGWRPVRYREDGTPRTRGERNLRLTSDPSRWWGNEPRKRRPPASRASQHRPRTRARHPTNWAHAPRGYPPQQRRSQTTGARRTHHNNRDTTQANRERTKKWQRPPALRSPVAPRPLPRPVRCPRNRSPPRGTYLRDTLTPPQGSPTRLASHRTRTERPCAPNPPDHHNGGTRTSLTRRK